MGFKLSNSAFNEYLISLKEKYKVYAPVTLKGKGTFSDTDSIRYSEVYSIEEMTLDKKSHFSFKELVLPITQTLFYFTEDSWIEPKVEEKEILIFLRSCDLHGIKPIDQIYLNNGYEDPYYKALREKIKFVLIGCGESFENCFCASMGTNKSFNYHMALNYKNEEVCIDIKDEDLLELFKGIDFLEKKDVSPNYVESNEISVKVPDNLDQRILNSKVWNEYSSRCIACGRCNSVCPTCTCFTMQDIFYKDNPKAGERRRVWASCHIDGFTTMAGGHEFRKDKGEKMRYKVMHKVYDFKKKFGYQMCVGCGRCDDICPEYISFSNCVNKLNEAMKEVE
ncbi:anaerobic sulfite reductase subunit AsrA [Clostridium amazonitimonense]|uniref:anaerobic sulfite reductase subunit AsrA n=1 Tax=Clostridium amazonitimonense TaxID=1499689 RepID=UPI0005099C2C|nr:anaerobic sulfite reductase subunit AsrA [Clostridium amazonitimonense]